MVTATVWRPGGDCSVHGVLHETAALLSSVAVAPPGLLVTITSCAADAWRTGDGAGLAGGSGCSMVFFAGSSAAALVSAGGAAGVAVCGACGAGPRALGLSPPDAVCDCVSCGNCGGAGDCACCLGSWCVSFGISHGMP